MANKYLGEEIIPALKEKIPAVVNTTGDSTTAAMSQKAVTDLVGDIDTALTNLDTGAGV